MEEKDRKTNVSDIDFVNRAKSVQEKAIFDNAREYQQKIIGILNTSHQNLSTKEVREIFFYFQMMRPQSKEHLLNFQPNFVALAEAIKKHSQQARLNEAEHENTFDGQTAWKEIREAVENFNI